MASCFTKSYFFYDSLSLPNLIFATADKTILKNLKKEYRVSTQLLREFLKHFRKASKNLILEQAKKYGLEIHGINEHVEYLYKIIENEAFKAELKIYLAFGLEEDEYVLDRIRIDFPVIGFSIFVFLDIKSKDGCVSRLPFNEFDIIYFENVLPQISDSLLIKTDIFENPIIYLIVDFFSSFNKMILEIFKRKDLKKLGEARWAISELSIRGIETIDLDSMYNILKNQISVFSIYKISDVDPSFLKNTAKPIEGLFFRNEEIEGEPLSIERSDLALYINEDSRSPPSEFMVISTFCRIVSAYISSSYVLTAYDKIVLDYIQKIERDYSDKLRQILEHEEKFHSFQNEYLESIKEGLKSSHFDKLKRIHEESQQIIKKRHEAIIEKMILEDFISIEIETVIENIKRLEKFFKNSLISLYISDQISKIERDTRILIKMLSLIEDRFSKLIGDIEASAERIAKVDEMRVANIQLKITALLLFMTILQSVYNTLYAFGLLGNTLYMILNTLTILVLFIVIFIYFIGKRVIF